MPNYTFSKFLKAACTKLLCQKSHITWDLHTLFKMWLFLITQFLILGQCYWYTKCHKKWTFIGRNVLISYALKVKSILLKNIPLLQCHNVCWIKPQHACFPLVPRITQTNLSQKKLLSRLTKLVFPSISLLLAVGLE